MKQSKHAFTKQLQFHAHCFRVSFKSRSYVTRPPRFSQTFVHYVIMKKERSNNNMAHSKEEKSISKIEVEGKGKVK